MISFLFTSYPFFLMSGYSWPSSAQPPVLKAISETFPITPYLRASTVITQMHGVWGDIVGDLWQSGIILLVGLAALWARLSFLRKKNTATVAA
jgi:ABC-2 type transport system permease protein